MSKLFKQQTLRYLLTLMDESLRVNLVFEKLIKLKVQNISFNRKTKVE
jgi:hypothetical protein